MFEQALSLLVGISDYQNQDRWDSLRLEKLRYAHKDARLIQQALLRLGFQEKHIYCFCNDDATKDNIESALDTIFEETRQSADRWVLMFFACHGLERTRFNNSHTYLLPYDSEIENLDKTGIDIQMLREALNGIRANYKVMFLDVCHSGGFDWNLVYQNLASTGTALIAACGREGVSLESDEVRHGLFTIRLVEVLCGLGEKDPDGAVTIQHVSHYLQATIPMDAKKYSNGEYEQNPYFLIEQTRPGFIIGRNVPATEVLDDETLPWAIRRRIRYLF